ncbi:MAG TPA: IS66 family transposase [Thermoanaerobaculia bacterium]|nr:IS66 family transposase [Thermoanaerobaculia bacterium]
MPEIEELIRINREQAQKIALLTQQVDWLKRQLFGRKSEKLDHPELFGPGDTDEAGKDGASDAGLPGEEAAPAAGGAGPARRRRPVRAAKLPADLPVVVEEIIPEEVLAVPGDFRRIGGESSDRLEKEPGYFYIRRTVRAKFARLDHPFLPPVVAPAPPVLIPNGFLGPGLLAEIIANKYCYHLPLYRQEQLYRSRFGIDLSRNTMGDAVLQVAEALDPVVRRMKENLLASGYIQADETPVTYLDPGHPEGSSTGYHWVYRGADGEVVFDWRTSREHHHLFAWLGPDYTGVLQADAYEAYLAYVRRQALGDKTVLHAPCLAHIRRKFEGALEERPEIARWFLRQIARLYATEDLLRSYNVSAEARARIRGIQSAPILRVLAKATLHLLFTSRHILPKSRLGQALAYAHKLWKGMEVYLSDGRVEIDNNLAENAIRPIALGRKNHLFIGSPEAGSRSATLYSLLVSAKAQGVDPQAYLRDLIERLPTAKTSELDALTPANWAEAYKAERLERTPDPTARVA